MPERRSPNPGGRVVSDDLHVGQLVVDSGGEPRAVAKLSHCSQMLA